VIRLEGLDQRDGTRTKSAKRREVPMRQVVFDLLAGRAGPREGRVWRQGEDRLRERGEGRPDRGLRLPRLPAPLRVLVRDAGRRPARPPGDPGPRRLEDDAPLRPPGPGAPTPGDGQDRGADRSRAQDTVSTKPRRYGRLWK
jgi:hypothetical protein